MKGTGFDARLWDTHELSPEEKPGGFCLMCCETFRTERQYRITKTQLSKLESAIDAASQRLDAVPGQANPLEAAQVAAMRSECEALATQILDYENLKTGEHHG